MKKTLLLSYSVPPALNGSACIVRNLSGEFRRDELVVAGEQWPDELPVKTNDAPQIYYLWKQPRSKVRVLRTLCAPLILARVFSIVWRERCEQIVVVFPSESYLLFAFLTSWLFRIPIFPYFHNTYVENRTGILRVYAKFLQRLVFKRAKLTFTMSEGMTRLYEEKYPSTRFVTLRHSFNGPLSFAAPRKTQEPPIEFGYLGNLNESNRDALARILRSIAQLPFETKVIFYTGQKAKLYSDLLSNQPERMQFAVSRCPFDQDVALELQKHDFVILPHGLEGGLTEIEYETIFPTRTIEYLRSSRPIIAHSPENSFLTKWLRERDCSVLITSPEEQAITNAISDLVDSPGKCSELCKRALASAAEFSADKIAQTLREHLEE